MSGACANCSPIVSLRLPGWLPNDLGGPARRSCQSPGWYPHDRGPCFACERGLYVRPPDKGVLLLEEIVLSNNKFGTVFLCDIQWGDVNVAVVDWSTVSTLGVENTAKHSKNDYGYAIAARAYRQLSVVLRNQGLNEHAARFSYRARLMQRKVFWYQRSICLT